MSEFTCRWWTVERLRAMRAAHDLPYKNNTDYDYAFAQSPDGGVISYCIEYWQRQDLDLSRVFVTDLWRQFSVKRDDDSATGERRRASKLVLDAFRHVYDMVAITQFSGLSVSYSRSNDRHGIDYVVTDARGDEFAIELSVSACGIDYRPTKAIRREVRGTMSHDVIQVRAELDALDTTHSPYVPIDSWYRHLPELIYQGRRSA